MKVIKTNFQGILLIQNELHFDTRGYLKEIFSNNKIKFKNKFQYYSISKKNVFRGLHFQKPQQSKIVSVIKGEIYDYALDLRKNSKTFKKIFRIKLTDKALSTIVIPKGFAHGFLSLKNNTILIYNNDNYRSKNEFGIHVHDPELKINLRPGIKISKKDKKNLYLKDFLNIYKTL